MRPRLIFWIVGSASLTVLVLLGRLSPSQSAWTGRPAGEGLIQDHVDRVIDGDTVELSLLGRARIIGIDTPERDEPGFDEATQFTASVVGDKWVEVEVCPVKPRDIYGRARVLVYYRDNTNSQQGLAEQIILHGHSGPSPLQPCHVDDAYWYSIRADGAREAN